MQYGMTYIVRPSMQPANSASIFACAASGSIQLLLGPASYSWGVQTKVRCSTRATSEGIGSVQIAVLVVFVEFVQGAVGQHLRDHRFVLGIAAVAKLDLGGFREFCDFVNPAFQ